MSSARKHWKEAQKWEKKWWGNCLNTFGEEMKQLTYAKKMGLIGQSVHGKYPVYDLKGASVLDIGGGAASILLKCINFESNTREGALSTSVIDPLPLPKWCKDRYETGGIFFKHLKGEDIKGDSDYKFDEVWIYNVLQHTEDPAQILKNALDVGKIIRIFEWVDMPIEEGHPIVLTEEFLNKSLNGEGKVDQVNENGCIGKCYYGIFRGNE